MYRIVLLGDTGAGKSSLANSILGEDVFKVVITECQVESKSLHGKRITLINTPDLFGPGRSEEDLKPKILRCITECAPGPHALLIVLKVEKSTEQQQAVIEKICQYFSEEAFKYATVVLTQDDQVSEKMKIKELIDQNKCLSDLVKKCKSRYYIVDKKYNRQGDNISNQVEALFNTIEQIVKENNGGWYTTKMLPQGDACNKANNSVLWDGLIKVTGLAAELVANAFFGPAPGTTNEAEEGRTVTDKEEGENKEVEKETQKIQKIRKWMIQKIRKVVEWAMPKIRKVAKWLGGGLGSNVGALFGSFSGLGGTILRGGAAITEGLKTALKTASDIRAAGIGPWVTQKISKVPEWVTQKLSKVVEWVMHKISKWVMQNLSTVLEWVMQKVSKVAEWVMQKVSKWVMQKISTVVEWVMQKIRKITELVMPKISKVAEWVGGGGAITEGLKTAFKTASDIRAAGIGPWVMQKKAEWVMQKISKWVMQKISKVVEWAMQKIRKIIELVVPKISKVAEWLVKKVNKVEWVMQKISKVRNWIIQNMYKVIEWIRKTNQVLQTLSHHRGVILLVFVFYSLLLLWLFHKVPFTGILILLQFLLLIIILVVIQFQH